MSTCPLFYAESYFVDIGGPAHVFPMEKFPAVPLLLVEHGRILPADLTDPGFASEGELLRVHTAAWLDAVRTGQMPETTRRRLGLPDVPGLFDRSRAEVAGTVRAGFAALETGLACNLAGGTHHAFADRGEGFCVFNDVAVAIRALHAVEPALHVMVVDLDAHQGNGTNALFADDPRVYTYSVHVAANYPAKKVPGSEDVGLPRYATFEQYEAALRGTLPAAVERFEPDLVFYIAGVDVHACDRFGQMQLSTEQMAWRDRYAIELCRGWTIPTAVLYGGGYHRDRPTTAALHAQTVAIALEIAAQPRQ